MSTSIQEKFADSVKTELASQQEHWAAFGNKALEESMSLLELNMQATTKSFEKFTRASQQLLAAKSPQEFFALDSDEIREELNQMLSYGGKFSSIASSFQEALNQSSQTQFSNNCGMATKLYEETVSLAPGNSNGDSDFMKTALENMKAGFDLWTDSARKTFQSVGDNLKLVPPGSTSSPKKIGKVNHKVEVHG